MKSGIYKITNSVNGKFYIGSSKNIEERWNYHIQHLRGGYHINLKLQHAWNFYGEDKFQFNIIEEVDPNEKLLLEREQHHLDIWKPYHRTIGYNILTSASGGDGYTHNPNREEICNKLSKMFSGEKNGMFGKKHTNQAIQQQKEKAKGRYTLEWFVGRYGNTEGKIKFEERRQVLINRKINYSYNNKMTGKKRGPMSEEIKKRISQRKAKLKLIRNDLHKDIQSDQYTMSQLSEKYDISMTTIKNEKRKLNNH